MDNEESSHTQIYDLRQGSKAEGKDSVLKKWSWSTDIHKEGKKEEGNKFDRYLTNFQKIIFLKSIF